MATLTPFSLVFDYGDCFMMALMMLMQAEGISRPDEALNRSNEVPLNHQNYKESILISLDSK